MAKIPLIITRPQEEGQKLKKKLEDLGFCAVLAPLLAITTRPVASWPQKPYQAICLTSANALSDQCDWSQLRSLPILTVGAHSAQAARTIGFSKISIQGPNVEALINFIINNLKPELGPLLYLSGAEISVDLKRNLESHGFEIDRIILYEAHAATSLTPQTIDAMRHEPQTGILLYSPRTAAIWHDLIDKSDMKDYVLQFMHFCLSRNVAARLPKHYHRAIAAQPQEAAMIDLIRTKLLRAC